MESLVLPQGSKVEVLVFDMGHVFVDFDWSVVCEGFCRISGRTPEELRKGFRRVAALGYESGRISTKGFLAELNRYLDATISLEQFKQLWNATFHENEEMAVLLTNLKEQRPLYLLSNTNEIHFEHLESKFHVTRHFTEVILSYRVGCSKPEEDIYHEVLRRSGKNAERCLFVDDLEANVEAARAIGMNALQFKSVQQLKSDLAGYGFKV